MANTTAAKVGAAVGAASAAKGETPEKSQKKSRLKPLLLVLLIAILATFLLSLAYPRLHASLLYLPVDTAINRYDDTQQVNNAQLTGLQQRAQESIAIHPHYRYHDGLSVLFYLQAIDQQRPLFERQQAFEASIEAAEASLDKAPAQPRTWLRIAQARSWLRYSPEQVIDALAMSIYTGRVEPSLLMTRLDMGFTYLPRMDGEATALLRDQLVLAWQMMPRDITRGIKSGSLDWVPVESLLSDSHPDLLQQIQEATRGPAK